MNTLLDEALDVVHYFPSEGNSVYLRQMKADAGQVIGSHRHAYEHYSILCSGRALVEVAGHVQELEGPAVITVLSGLEHKFTAVTDIVWICVHGTSETDPESIDRVLIGG